MAVYMIVEIAVKDRDLYAKYVEQVGGSGDTGCEVGLFISRSVSPTSP